jgi:DNA invertase Pin-like site-specific DNA recombinase
LVVTKLDRLARSVAHLMEIRSALQGKGAFLRILNLNLDTSTATGKLMMTMLGAVAEFERDCDARETAGGDREGKGRGEVQGPEGYGEVKSAPSEGVEGPGTGSQRDCQNARDR